mmetsp:Transcript_15704/g.17734  ORF Transcript_15704/g.17734 Transcript_15704/m.17734 type:complete len:189 (-) Transcript_15704:31-597(-)|eukprot:CAMPEP_0184073146 /NCGR_PEP_ID=MMETSP0957-20130417/62952_1 /TAXON_ID=627963 /ORGANISM="Aplanochytrium sp, Strain PBS07" /LENGTH=188 /DNA_ID=CAMNT_0026374591 /DNA_START=127 /DNA_END=696 /DNA_ORIENTATION=-
MVREERQRDSSEPSSIPPPAGAPPPGMIPPDALKNTSGQVPSISARQSIKLEPSIGLVVDALYVGLLKEDVAYKPLSKTRDELFQNKHTGAVKERGRIEARLDMYYKKVEEERENLLYALTGKKTGSLSSEKRSRSSSSSSDSSETYKVRRESKRRSKSPATRNYEREAERAEKGSYRRSDKRDRSWS